MGRFAFLVLASALVLSAAGCRGEPDPGHQPWIERTTQFLAVGDTGTGGTDQKKVAGAMKALIDKEGVDFIVMLGDNFYESGVSSVSDPLWKTRYEDVYGVWGLPVYAILGNHDYGGIKGAGTEEGKGAIQVAYTLTSSTWKMPAQFYHFVQGPADFTALDTNRLKMNVVDTLGQGPAVQGWLNAASGWKIVLGHHPYRSNGPHGNAGTWDGLAADPASTTNGAYFRAFFEAYIVGKADLYLCGHDHSLQVLDGPESGEGPLMVVSGAGGKLSTLPGNNPTRFQSLSFGFAAVSYDSHTLVVRLFDADGAMLHITRLVR